MKQTDAGQDEGYSIQFVIGFAGFPVPAAGKLEVRATIDGVVLRGNSLEITVDDVSTATTGPEGR